MEAIKDWFFWHKQKIVWAGILLLVSTISFGIGRISERQFDHAAIMIEKCSVTTSE